MERDILYCKGRDIVRGERERASILNQKAGNHKIRQLDGGGEGEGQWYGTEDEVQIS